MFSSWSDGKGQQHSIVTGATPSTYTATFKSCTKSGTSAAETLSGTSAADVICGHGGNDTIDGLGRQRHTSWRWWSGQGEGQRRVQTASMGRMATTRSTPEMGLAATTTLDGGAGTDTKVTDPTEKSIVGFP